MIVRRVRHEQPRFAAGGGHGPDVAAGDERDLALVGRDAGSEKERRAAGAGTCSREATGMASVAPATRAAATGRRIIMDVKAR